MPKRKVQKKIDRYREKIKILEGGEQRKRLRIIYSDSSDENNSDDVLTESVFAAVPSADQPPSQEADMAQEPVPELDADFLSALGDAAEDTPGFGENIHPTLADRWLPILRRGIPKEPKERLLKEQLIPDNCKLLKAPTLNPEISAAITEAARNRDKKLENAQQQLGLGITAINRAMAILFTSDDKENKVQAVKILSDACRILCDLHYMDTQTRIKLITPALDKAFLTIVQDLERDESLFGRKLSEKIKASKAIEKQGLQIKKNVVSQKASTPSTPQSTTRTRPQGNWSAPSRYQQSSNRGGRGGSHRISATAHRPGPQAATQAKSSQSKPRAAHRQ
ncbi:uncharacterized protein LOC126367441 [Pectinophora gossypiella]|uniref:uncharacterized protein LOC126367441 n=1 Tax=Pectinophora gossypiella TaxID=13191 RepID=UPI00214E96AA|nr:uncharacterized protein LOC126367441 [Pectinophora gossypiella]XP_049866910.1 uncharacterized protein LOC126367441 [Pectinophora gossypiella]